MTGAETPGPEVPAHEDLYRGLTTSDWWVPEQKRASSAAFRFPCFSVDIASAAGSPEFTLGHLPAGSGLVSFKCEIARQLGFTARHEADPEQPDNKAHANVYCDLPNKQRKRAAEKLARSCTVLVAPTMD